ncbi:MAG: glutamate racemase [Solirubrobacterales bacterium]
MEKVLKPIGFFDSGVGGISVLKEAVKLLPKENYIYFGDSKNAPYGVKTVEEVKELTFNAVNFLMDMDVKAVVIACNTATSAAIEDLRSTFQYMPVIGIEPALKPAMEYRKNGKIIIMATTMTLAEKKFSNLLKRYHKEAEILPMPCPGLVEYIESGVTEGPLVEEYLKEKFKPYMASGVGAVVLGCTHYPFVKHTIQNILGNDTPVIDGSSGTASQLKRQLTKHKILNESNTDGYVKIFNSINEEKIIELSYKLLRMP